MKSILLISAFLALFLAVLALFLKRKTFSDFLLASWLIFIAIHMVTEYLQFYNFENGYPWPWLIGINLSFPAIHPVLIFLYILSFVNPKTGDRRIFWNLVPILLLNLVLTKTYYLKTYTEKIDSFNFAMAGEGFSDKGLEISFYLVISVTLAYLFASYWLLVRHERNVKNIFSTLEGIDLKWLRVVLYSTGIILLIAIILEWISNNSDYISPVTSSTIIFLLILLGICYIGIHGIRQSTIFTDVQTEMVKERITSSKPDKEGNPVADQFPEDRLEEAHYEKLIRYMEQEKPFLDSDLNLPGLAQKVGFKTHYLSRLINKRTAKNFFDFVNTFRVEAFKEKVRQKDSHMFTILSLAYDCGFNSKTTFNRVFKNQTGQTPSDFYKENSIS